MKIFSWNVNGARAILKKGFLDWFQKEDADLYCLQEVKAFYEQLPTELQRPFGYNSVFHAGERPGYSGTAIYSRIDFSNSRNEFDKFDCFSEDGRVTQMDFANISVLNIYFPNGGSRADGTEMLSYKLNFYDRFIEYVNYLQSQGQLVIACGDYNICHTEIDIARPKENENSIGFLPVERDKIGEMMEKTKMIDVFRTFNPDLRDKYTWWSYRAGARPRNVGWRIDYFMVSEKLLAKIKSITHHDDVMGSDHCPLSIDIDV